MPRRYSIAYGGQVKTVEAAAGKLILFDPENGIVESDGLNGGRLIDLPALPQIVATPVPRVVTLGTVEEVTVQDRVYDRHTSASSVYDYTLDIDWKGSTIPESAALEWVSRDTNKATVDQNGNLTHIAAGSVKVVSKAPALNLELPINLTMGEYADVTDIFKGFADGSAAKDATDAVDTRIAGTDRDVARHIYTSFPSNSNYTDAGETRGGVDEFIRNPAFWGADLDLTCISPAWRTIGGTWKRSPTWTLLTEDIVITCAHWSPPGINMTGDPHTAANHEVAFVRMDNTLVVRKVIMLAYAVGDISIGILETPITFAQDGISPAKVLPVNRPTYIPLMSDIPGLLLDQQEHGLVHDLSGNSRWKYPTDPKRFEFVDIFPGDNRVDRTGIELYDSGNPSFLILNGELVLITVWTGGSGGSGSDLQTNATSVQSAIDALVAANGKPASSLSYSDLSTFNSY